MSPPRHAVAFAPASVGNVAVGFDVLGYSAPVAGDRVRAARTDAPGVRIAGVTGVVGRSAARVRAQHGRHGGRRDGRGARSGFRLRADDRERDPSRIGPGWLGGVGGGGGGRRQRAARPSARQPPPVAVRDARRDGCERDGAHRQHRAVALRRPGALGRHRQSAHQADPGAVHGPVDTGSAPPRTRDARREGAPRPHGPVVRRRVAAGQPRGIRHGVLHCRSAA